MLWQPSLGEFCKDIQEFGVGICHALQGFQPNTYKQGPRRILQRLHFAQGFEGTSLNQCYRNRTGTGKTGRSDRFTGLAGPVSKFFWKNRFFFQTGYGTGLNRPEPAWTGRSGLGIQGSQFFLKKPENKTLLMYFGASDVLWSVYCGSNSQESWSLILFSSSKLKFVKVILSLGFELRNATKTTTIIG